ncbi:hypothetical protein ABZ682_40390 [Streptomyces griseoviridis]|uniref:hypothetical protein n=1 Tax=Streptomyces TaxID=1883 RepID=UPI0024747318|nr:hypothetical protein [Streptomyces sp. MAA16]MDH6703194.1 hypothetical protein [Streptomyces sp. MAA16]
MPNVDENRRTPEELSTLDLVEPGMKEVIVEGRGDAGLLRWFFSQVAPDSDIAFFAVTDRVLIDSDIITGRGHNAGQRGAVVATAEIVSERAPRSSRVIFVADRDCNSLGLDACPELGNILYTDFAAMELYCLSPKTIGKVLSVALRAPDRIDAQGVIDALIPTLVTLFRIRATVRSLPEPQKLAGKVMEQLHFKPAGSDLDAEDALARSVKGYSRKELSEAFSRFEVPENLDPRHYIRGHDIAAVFIKYIASMHPNLLREDRRHFAQATAMEICMMSSLEVVDLEQYGLFGRLKEYALKDLNADSADSPKLRDTA